MPNFISQQAQGRKPIYAVEQQQTDTVSWRLSLYNEPPRNIITIEDFERFAIDRLRGAPTDATVHIAHMQKHTYVLQLSVEELQLLPQHATLHVAVLKGIEDFKAKGFHPPAVQDEARRLADKHLKVSLAVPLHEILSHMTRDNDFNFKFWSCISHHTFWCLTKTTCKCRDWMQMTVC